MPVDIQYWLKRLKFRIENANPLSANRLAFECETSIANALKYVEPDERCLALADQLRQQVDRFARQFSDTGRRPSHQPVMDALMSFAGCMVLSPASDYGRRVD